MAHLTPAPLPRFSRGPCPKCGHEVLRVRWCDGSLDRRVRGESCPDGDRDHVHLTCPICTYTTVCAPLDGGRA